MWKWLKDQWFHYWKALGESDVLNGLRHPEQPSRRSLRLARDTVKAFRLYPNHMRSAARLFLDGGSLEGFHEARKLGWAEYCETVNKKPLMLDGEHVVRLTDAGREELERLR